MLPERNSSVRPIWQVQSRPHRARVQMALSSPPTSATHKSQALGDAGRGLTRAYDGASQESRDAHMDTHACGSCARVHSAINYNTEAMTRTLDLRLLALTHSVQERYVSPRSKCDRSGMAMIMTCLLNCRQKDHRTQRSAGNENYIARGSKRGCKYIIGSNPQVVVWPVLI